MEKYDSRLDTQNHIYLVKEYIYDFCGCLEDQVQDHDKTKLEEPEKSILDKITPQLKDMSYWGNEYQKSLEKMGNHHHKHNRHHPEFFENGIKDMNLVDLIEMFCDWCAATTRHNNGNIIESIDKNAERFGFDEPLKQIMKNTAKQLEMGKEFDD